MSFFRRKKFTINEPDPVFNVTYLGNVITMLARGENCYEKPLALIWKTFCTRKRPDMGMKLVVTRSGLKAHTKQQGLTEYWVHRTTFCAAPETYPRVFVWIYKHDGKKMKPELRCHAALCRRSDTPRVISDSLHSRISAALMEYRREKLSKQKVRIATGGSLPRRKQILSTGTQNFRPPMARSKSAPKLQAIEECLEEEETIDADDVIIDTDDVMSIPSSAGFSVNDSPSGGCRDNIFSYPRATMSMSETQPDLFDQTSNQTLERDFSLELDDMTDRIAEIALFPRRTVDKFDPPLESLEITMKYSPPLPPHLDDIDQYSDESGYEEKTSLESCDEGSEKTITCL